MTSRRNVVVKQTFSVRDYGPDIAGSDRSLLFERFWRKDRIGSQGAGRGLGIVKRLVDAHGGGIFVEPPAGGGALFRVRFQGPGTSPGALTLTL